MSISERSQTQFSDRDFSGILTNRLLTFLQSDYAGVALDEVLRSAGETRAVSTLIDHDTWSSYAQVRQLLEAAATSLGGSTKLSQVGAHAFASTDESDSSRSLIGLDSPFAIYAALPNIIGGFSSIIELETQSPGPNEFQIRFRLNDGHEPFRELCNFLFGMYAAVPMMFGLPCAEISIESCQSDGAHFCQAQVRWSVAGDATSIIL